MPVRIGQCRDDSAALRGDGSFLEARTIPDGHDPSMVDSDRRRSRRHGGRRRIGCHVGGGTPKQERKEEEDPHDRSMPAPFATANFLWGKRVIEQAMAFGSLASMLRASQTATSAPSSADGSVSCSGLRASCDAPMSPGRPPHIRALTSLRGVFALWVVVFHFWNDVVALFPSLRPLEPLAQRGDLAVPGFFVLSGFVLARNHLADFERLQRAVVLRFLGLRLVRIYPVHLATLVAVLVLVVFARQGGLALNQAGYLGLAVRPQPGPCANVGAPVHPQLEFPGVVHQFGMVCLSDVSIPRGHPVETSGDARQGGHRIRARGRRDDFCLPRLEELALSRIGRGRSHLRGRDGRQQPRREAPEASAARPADSRMILRAPGDWASFIPGLAGARVAPGGDPAVGARARCRPPLAAPFWELSPLVFLGEVSYSLYMTHTLALKVINRTPSLVALRGQDLITRVLVLSMYVGLIALTIR